MAGWPRWLGRARAARRAGPRPQPPADLEPLVEEVLLRRLERLSLVPRRPVAGGLGGEHRSSARASSTDFADYRPYIPGDDFRRIDWNAYGRFGTLYVKLTEAREQLPVHILLDASRSMAWGEPAKLQLRQPDRRRPRLRRAGPLRPPDHHRARRGATSASLGARARTSRAPAQLPERRPAERRRRPRPPA